VTDFADARRAALRFTSAERRSLALELARSLEVADPAPAPPADDSLLSTVRRTGDARRDFARWISEAPELLDSIAEDAPASLDAALDLLAAIPTRMRPPVSRAAAFFAVLDLTAGGYEPSAEARRVFAALEQLLDARQTLIERSPSTFACVDRLVLEMLLPAPKVKGEA
jgi:hypothetical protein